MPSIERTCYYAAGQQSAQSHTTWMQRPGFRTGAGEDRHSTADAQGILEFLDGFVTTALQRAMGVEHRTCDRHAGIFATVDDGVFHVAFLLPLQQFVQRCLDLPRPAP